MEQLSRIDSLTGLLNQRAFYEQLRIDLSTSSRRKDALTLAYLDLNGFKEINDTQGHKAGDRILSFVGECMRRVIREGNFGCRYGGDEFMTCLLNLNAKDSIHLGKRLIEAVQSAGSMIEGGGLSVGLSVGVALFPENSEDVNDVIEKADRALYEAKKRGKNQICGWWEKGEQD